MEAEGKNPFAESAPELIHCIGQVGITINYHRGKMAFHRWMYHEGRPNRIAKFLNWIDAVSNSLGILPESFVTLEVVGRKSGKIVRFPLAMTVMNGERYLVSMLGEDSNWVRNVRSAGGRARLLHGIREQVLLEEVDVRLRAPILKAYLQLAPGARPHVPVSKDAHLSEFEKIAHEYPVFRVRIVK